MLISCASKNFTFEDPPLLAPDETATIAGSVTSEETAHPVEGATVRVLKEGTQTVWYIVATDDRGKFIVSVAPGQAYDVHVEAYQYLSREIGLDRLKSGQHVPLLIELREDVAMMDGEHYDEKAVEIF